jgi:hypothetical protein
MSTIPEQSPSPHEETAQAMLVQLRQLAHSVPGFAFIPARRRRQLSASASVSDDFLQAVSVACDAQPRLGPSGEITGAELRGMVTFSRQYNSVADELVLLAEGLRGTVAVLRSDVCRRALRVYANAKRIESPEEMEKLIPHLADMKRTLGRAKRSEKKKQAGKEPVTDPAKETKS